MNYHKLKFTVLFLIAGIMSYAQTPDLYPPTVPDPIDVSFYNIVLYVLLPLGIIVAFFVYGYAQKKKKQERKSRNNENQDKNINKTHT